MNKLEGRPTALKLGTSNFRPFKMPSLSDKRPQTFFNEKRMGQKRLGAGSFSAKELPLSLSIGAGSAGAIIFGYSLGESQWKGILIGAGLMGLGYSIYNLFSGPSDSSSGVKEEGDFSALSAKPDFDSVTGKFINPKMYEQKYPFWDKKVNLLLTNQSSRPVSFTLIVSEYEGTSEEYGGDAFRKPVTIPANGTLPVSFSVTKGAWSPTTIKLVAKKLRSAGDEPVKIAELVYFD